MVLIPSFFRADSSIQRRLLFSMIAVVVAGIAVTGVVVYRQAREEANALFDQQLQQLAQAYPVRAYGALAPQAPGAPRPPEDVVVRIWNRFGVFVYSSHPDVALPASAQLGLTTVATPRGDWRVFAVLVDESLLLEVAQPMRVRSALAAEVAFRTVLPLLILLPILAGLLWWVVGRGLAPLRRVAAEVGARRPEALERLSEDALPQEVAPLVASLNRLLADLAIARDAQRAFIADAAHELRTPLTALQLQLQVVERADDPNDRADALNALRDGLLRASRLVEQLLALARAEPDAAPASTGAVTRVDLDALVREAVSLQVRLAHDRGIDLGVDGDERDVVAVDGDRDALFTLLGNLIDNALRYTPRGGRVDVGVERTADAVALSVRDDGPGISPAERERVFDRFHRGDAARAAGDTRGSGLGLAIVKRIADRHGARVTLHPGPDGRGLSIQIAFPLPT
ncbi:MAG: ATP-binding protein [Burkholderiaceae bacterium]